MPIDVNINLNKVFSVVLHEEKKEEKENKDGTEPAKELEQETRNYRYPLTLNESYPAYITFTAVEVETVDFSEVFRGAAEGLALVNPVVQTGRALYNRATSEENESEAEKTLADEVTDVYSSSVDEIKEAGAELVKAGKALQSYDNKGNGTPVGSVMLPLQKSLQFNDTVAYNVADLGVSGSMAGALMQGENPFEGMLGGDGKVTRAAGGLAAQVISKNAAAVLGGALGSKAGTAGAVLGFGAGGSLGDGIGDTIKAASRVSANPNQRTLFDKVGMRDFSFTFKMVANNEKESREIRDIIQFFREELYPEPVTTDTGVQLAYEFPNMFDIEIKNFVGDSPSPKIQRCYLVGVQTNYNATASTMHPDGNFVEVDVVLNFKETTALNKKKVREGGY